MFSSCIIRLTFRLQKSGSGATLPLKIQIFSRYGDMLEFQLPAVTPLAITDTGGQFKTPPAGTGGASPSCDVCPIPLADNGNYLLIDNGVMFPQNTGYWRIPASLGLTDQQYMDNTGKGVVSDASNARPGVLQVIIALSRGYGVRFSSHAPPQVTSRCIYASYIVDVRMLDIG